MAEGLLDESFEPSLGSRWRNKFFDITAVSEDLIDGHGTHSGNLNDFLGKVPIRL